MTDTNYSDGRTGGGRYIQDPKTGLLTKEEPAIEQPAPDQVQPDPVIDETGEQSESEKKGTK